MTSPTQDANAWAHQLAIERAMLADRRARYETRQWVKGALWIIIPLAACACGWIIGLWVELAHLLK